MSDTPEKKEKKKYENGTRSINHLKVESAKFNTAIKKLDGTTFQGCRLVCTSERFGNKDIKVAEAALNQSFNAAIKKQFKDVCDAFKIAFQNDEELWVTYESEYNASSGYWNPKSIQIGKHGNEGLVQNGGGSPNGNSNGGGGYSNDDAAAGQVMNIAVAMLQAKGTKGGFDMAAVQSLALDIVDAYNDCKAAVKAAIKGVAAPAQKPESYPEAGTSAAEGVSDTPSDDMSFDDDVPY